VKWYDFAASPATCGAIFCARPHRQKRRRRLFAGLLMAADGDMDRAMGMSEGVGL